MKTVAVAVSKGGVGKTTTAVHLAAAWAVPGGAASRGRRVLLVDCDTQGQAGLFLGMDRDVPGLAELLLDEPAEPVEVRPGLCVLTGGPRLSDARQAVERKLVSREGVLAALLRRMATRGGFDLCVLDAAPGLDILTINILMAADVLLAPVSLGMAAVDGLRGFLEVVDEVGAARAGGLRLDMVLPTAYTRRLASHRAILAELQRHFGAGRVLPPIPATVRLPEAVAAGQSIFEFDPASPAAEAYADVALRVAALLAEGV